MLAVDALPSRVAARAEPAGGRDTTSLAMSGARLPHICFVAPDAWPVLSGNADIKVVGGAEVQQSLLARLLVRAGYQVSMICLDYGQAQAVVVDGITVYKAHHPDAGIPGVRFLYPRLSSMWQVMRRVDADIYYQRSAAMLTAVVAAFCHWHGKKSIYAGASDPDFLPGQQGIRYRRDRWLFERGLASVDRLVVQNTTQQQSCREHYGRESVLIPSCYQRPLETPRSTLPTLPARQAAGKKIVLWVATLHRGKRPELFLELARRLPQYRFVMIGGASGNAGGESYYQTVRAAALTLANLSFIGFLPLAQVELYFDQAWVLVNTSPHEGMPNTFLQAWARGIPTVAFIDMGARWRNEPVYRVVQDVAEAADEIERLHTEEIYRYRRATRCLEYFTATHSPLGVLAQYEHLLLELTDKVAV